MGGRVFRNYYKGHMDKTKGEGEAREEGGFGQGRGERRGENADNCKIFKWQKH